MTETKEPRQVGVGAIARLFLKLGTIGFGGPAAHIAMMEDEVVGRRKWLSRESFLDLLGATHLIPGPNSTEMAIHIGYRRGGWPGLLTAGICFILPAVLITGALAAVYVRWGTLPELDPILAGVKPVVVAVIAAALLRLGRTAARDWRLAMIGIAVAAVSYRQGFEVVALLAGGLLGMLWIGLRKPAGPAVWAGLTAALGAVPARAAAISAAAAAAGGAAAPVPLWTLGLFFLKVGAVLFGSGYVLIAFLEGGLVDDLGLITGEQLMEAVAVGQFTPGPVLSTATFIGYVIAGPWGALVATVAIFLPSFFYVAAVNPLIPRLRESRWAGAFLDGVNAGATGLMLAVTVKLAEASLTGGFSWWMAGMAFLIAAYTGMSPAWLILAGALTGYLVSMG